MFSSADGGLALDTNGVAGERGDDGLEAALVVVVGRREGDSVCGDMTTTCTPQLVRGCVVSGEAKEAEERTVVEDDSLSATVSGGFFSAERGAAEGRRRGW